MTERRPAAVSPTGTSAGLTRQPPVTAPPVAPPLPPVPPAKPVRRDEDDEDEVLGKAYDARIVSRTWTYVRPYRGRMALSVLLMIAIAAANLAQPYLIKVVIDRAILQGDVRLLTLTAVGYVGCALVSWLATYGQTYIMSWVGQSVLFAMRRELFVHLQRLSFSFYDNMEAGRIMSRMTGDVNALNDFLTSGIVAIRSIGRCAGRTPSSPGTWPRTSPVYGSCRLSAVKT